MLPGAGEVVTLEPARDQDAPAIQALLQECGLPVEDLEGVSGFLVARNGLRDSVVRFARSCWQRRRGAA